MTKAKPKAKRTAAAPIADLPRSKISHVKSTRSRIRRPLTVEAVPAKTYPADCVERFRSAHATFAAHGVRRLIEQGIYEIDEHDNVIIAKPKPAEVNPKE